MTTATVPNLEQAALALAALGYHIFPVRAGAKTPLTANGFKDATRDERQILHWWDTHPDANIGIACGASGISVLDIDSKSGANPTDVLAGHDLQNAPLVLTGKAPEQDDQHPASLTGVRGAQVYFKGSLPTGPLPVDGCEIRGPGAYVVAPPSRHPSGVRYTGQLPAASQLPPVPDWLSELAAKRNGKHQAAAPVEDVITAGGRNQALASIAGTMRRRGMGAAEIAAALQVTNRDRCRPPLPTDEVDKIAQSIARYEPAEAVNGSRSPHLNTDKDAAAAALTELLGLDAVDLKVTGGRIFGRGGGASADLILSDESRVTFETLRDMGSPTKLMLEITACTGATPRLKGPQAVQAVALLRQVAEHTLGPTADDLAMDWCRGYLRGAETLDVDMNDQRERWAAFSRLDESDPTPWKDEGALGTVLRHIDGTRYVRTGWFRNYVKAVHDHTVSPQQITARVARLGWQRAGTRGAIKATRPSGAGVLSWTFYIVPAMWEERNQ